MTPNVKMLVVRLPAELWLTLREEAKVQRLTLSALVRQKLSAVLMPYDAPSTVQIVRKLVGDARLRVEFPISAGVRRTLRMMEKRVRQKPTKAVKTLHSGRAK